MGNLVGRVVWIIYQDRKGAFTKRRVRVLAVKDGRLKAFCISSGAPRSFLLERILAVEPDMRAS